MDSVAISCGKLDQGPCREINTICPRSLAPLYIVSYYLEQFLTSWTYSMMVKRTEMLQSENDPYILYTPMLGFVTGGIKNTTSNTL